MSTVVIRRRNLHDLAALADILVRVHTRDGYPVEGVASPESWITPLRELAAWTALYRNAPIGHVALAQADENDEVAQLWQRATGGDIHRLAILARLFVDPDNRKVGAGSLLIGAARQFADARHLAIAFDVMLKDRDAIRLYEKLGCQPLGTIVHHHSGGKSENAMVYSMPGTPGRDTAT